MRAARASGLSLIVIATWGASAVSAQDTPPVPPAAAEEGQAEAKPTTLALRGVLHRPGASPLADGVVVLTGGKIVAVGAFGEVAIPEGAPVLSVPAISPGLIDASTSAGTEGIYAEQASEVVPELRVLDEVDLSHKDFSRLLARGVTAVYVGADPASVIGSQGCVLKTAGAERVLIEAGSVQANIGPESWSRGFNRRPSGAPSHMTRRPGTLMGAVWVFREAFFEARRAKEPSAAQATLRQILGGERELRFQVRRRGEIEAALRLTREQGVGVVLEEAQEVHHLIDLLVQAQAQGQPVRVILGPLEDLGRSQARGVLEPRLDTPALLALAGVEFCLSANDERDQDDVRGQAMLARRYGLGSAQALDAVTAAPARILGVEGRVGLLKVGLDADLVVWSGPPLAATSKALAVLIDGQLVYGQLGAAKARAQGSQPKGSKTPQRF